MAETQSPKMTVFRGSAWARLMDDQNGASGGIIALFWSRLFGMQTRGQNKESDQSMEQIAVGSTSGNGNCAREHRMPCSRIATNNHAFCHRVFLIIIIIISL